jgi:hypothetical protein
VLKPLQVRWTDGGDGVGWYCHYHFLSTCFQTFCFPSPICICSSSAVIMSHLRLSPAYRRKHLKSFDVHWCFCFGLIISASCCSFFMCDPFANSLHALFVYCRFRAPCFTRIACMAQETCGSFRLKICCTHQSLICARHIEIHIELLTLLVCLNYGCSCLTWSVSSELCWYYQRFKVLKESSIGSSTIACSSCFK